MRRLGLLFAGAGLWLFLAAIPALADGGPHVSTVNSGSSTLTADSCAGCHRAHTAQGEYLLAAQSEEDLCLSCHDGTGATTDVLTGVQYVPTGLTGAGTALGALRDGGFDQARIDTSDPGRMSYIRGYENGPENTIYAISERPKVGVLGAPLDVTSAHIDLAAVADNGIADTGRTWGKGASGLGTSNVVLECVECHNPHGNGQYRILRPVPGIEVNPLGAPVAVTIKATYASNDTLVTEGQNGLVVADTVTIAGLAWDVNNISAFDSAGVFTTTADHGLAPGSSVVIGGTVALTGYPAGTYAVATTPSFRTFTLTTGDPSTPYTWASGDYPTITPQDGVFTVTAVTNGFTFKVGPVLDFSGAGASVVRPEVAVADTPTDPDGNPANGIENPTKNYTVLQTKGSQGNLASFLLYARDVVDADGGFGVAADRPAVSISGVVAGTNKAIASISVGNLFNATGHGFSVNGSVYVTGIGGLTDGWYVVATVPSKNSFTLIGVSGLADDAGTARSAGYFQTTGTTNGHGLAAGDEVVFPSGDWPAGGFTPTTTSTKYTIAGISSGGAYYDRFTLVGVNISTTEVAAGTVVRKGIGTDYSATGGDYFRRTVPWNPALTNESCDNSIFSSTNSQHCATMNDAPNGRPATITSGPTALIGQQAFLDQMSTWCMQCHTRYYSASNENVGYADDPISDISDRDIGRTMASGEIFPMLFSQANGQYGSPGYGDKVTFDFASGSIVAGTEYFVVETGSLGGRNWFKVSGSFAGTAVAPGNAGTSPWDTSLGTFTRTEQYSNSSWGYPRNDATYKYQHSTASNRACVVCHVSHGSNALMNGENGTTFSTDFSYPDGSVPVIASSRLLKVDNRGTCQMCHDPTGTMGAGDYNGNTGFQVQVP